MIPREYFTCHDRNISPEIGNSNLLAGKLHCYYVPVMLIIEYIYRYNFQPAPDMIDGHSWSGTVAGFFCLLIE